MIRRVVSVNVEEDQERVAQKMKDYDFIAMPVIDYQHHLVGIITIHVLDLLLHLHLQHVESLLLQHEHQYLLQLNLSKIEVKEALMLVKSQAPDAETIYVIYVVDTAGQLVGVLSLKDS
jgi:Mg/Co/Ni transporter MgtE